MVEALCEGLLNKIRPFFLEKCVFLFIFCLTQSLKICTEKRKILSWVQSANSALSRASRKSVMCSHATRG